VTLDRTVSRARDVVAVMSTNTSPALGHDPRSIALAYVEAAARKDYAACEQLLAPDAVIHGPAAACSGAAEVTGAYRRLAPIHVASEVRKTFAEGGDVCVIYDFVTDTPAAAVPTMEWFKVEGGRITSIWLLTDHVRWPKALDALRARMAANA